MKSGRLRDRVEFQRRSTAVNRLGEAEGKWTSFAIDFADVEPLSGREFFAAQQAQYDATTRISCRYSKALSEVTVKDRIKHGEVIYDIRSVIDLGNRRREIQFMCTQHSI